MSTVLDALRRLQREREAKLAPLERSVTDLISVAPPRRQSVLPWVGASLAALLAASAVGFWLGPLRGGRLAAENRARESASPSLARFGSEVELSEQGRSLFIGQAQ